MEELETRIDEAEEARDRMKELAEELAKVAEQCGYAHADVCYVEGSLFVTADVEHSHRWRRIKQRKPKHGEWTCY